jgi:hypothetical protein
MCKQLTRFAIEACDPEVVELDVSMDITDQQIAEAFDYEEVEIEEDHCPSGCNGSGCHNCR